MKIIKGILRALILPLLLLLISTSVFSETPTVLIIKSSDNSFFNRSIQQLVNRTSSKVNFKIIALDSLKKNNSELKQKKLIITLGQQAADFLQNKNSTPVIHSYITHFQFNRKKKEKNHYTILLDQPLRREFSFIKLLVNPKNIGVINNKANAIDMETIDELQSAFNVTLNQQFFNTGDNPVTMVRDILKTSDVLLSLPNPQLYNRQTLKGILLTSYRQNKPVISYSPAHVKSGALASIYSSPENIGNQIAELLNNILFNRHFKPESHYYASEYDIKINQRVAKSLGLSLPDKAEILVKLRQSEAP